MMKTLFSVMIVMGMLAASPAQALRLDNCDKVPRSFIVDYYGETVTVNLQPGQSRVLAGRAREVQLVDGETMYLWRPHDEYCAKDGHIQLQRRNKNNKKVR